MISYVTKLTTWTTRKSLRKPATRLPVEAPETALSITNREDEDSSFLKYKRAAAVPPTLNKEEEDTVVGVNSLLH